MKGLKGRENLPVSCRVLFAIISYISAFLPQWVQIIMTILPPLGFYSKLKLFYIYFQWNLLLGLISVSLRIKESPPPAGTLILHVFAYWLLLMRESYPSIPRCFLQWTVNSPSVATMVLPSSPNSKTWHIAEHTGDPAVEIPSRRKPCRSQGVQKPLLVLSCNSDKRTGDTASSVQGGHGATWGPPACSMFCDHVYAVLSISSLISQWWVIKM